MAAEEDRARQLQLLFTKVNDMLKKRQMRRAEKALDELLGLAPDDPDAIAAKLYVLIDTSRTKNALDMLTSNPDNAQRFPFEYAYCLYKEGRVEDALQQLENVPGQRVLDRKRLEGQLYYRLERYDACIQVYTEIFKGPYNEDSVEAKANLVAAYVAAGRSGEIAGALADIGCASSAEESLEVSFNVACGLIASGKLRDAREQLVKTQRIGEETLFDEGLEDDEVAEELAGVDAQVAYIDAVEGARDMAMEGSQQVLRLDGPDDLANVVAAANGVLLQVESDPRDRKRAQERLKDLEPFLERVGGLLKVTSGLEVRLGRAACIGVLAAYACGSLAANKSDHAKEAVRSLEKMYPGEALGALLHASISAREGKTKEAMTMLESNAGKFAGSAVEVGAVSLRAQLMAHGKAYVEAADTLGDGSVLTKTSSSTVPLSCAPALIATRCALYELGNNLEMARNTALSALNDEKGDSLGKAWALKKLADIQLSSGNLVSATECLVQLTQADVTAWEDADVLNTLPRCIACCDPSRHADVLAAVGGDLSPLKGVDVDMLEARAGSMLSKNALGQNAGDNLQGDDGKEKREKKRKKKRKIIFPKGFDPEHPERTPAPDPERWLPKWQRSENKKLRKKKAKAGHVSGSQGAGKVDASLDYSMRDAKPATVAPSSKQGKKKGGKKGRR